MGKVSYRPKRNQGKQDIKKQYIPKSTSRETLNEMVTDEAVKSSKVEEVGEKISVSHNHRGKKSAGQLESIKVVGDMDCAYHIYVEDYVYTYIYQLAAADLAKESSAILVGEIYTDSKEAVVKGIIPVNMDKLADESEWIDIGVAEEAEAQRKNYFKDLDIIGWMHMQPGYGTMLTMKELREHQNVFEGNGTLCMLVDAINKIETVYVYEDEELKEQSGYCMYYERNEEMQQYMLDHPFNVSVKEEMKDTVVNQFREIGKMRKEEYAQRKNLNVTVVAASIILIALTAVIVKMNESKAYNEAAQMTNVTVLPTENNTMQSEELLANNLLDDILGQKNTDAVGEEVENLEQEVETEQNEVDLVVEDEVVLEEKEENAEVSSETVVEEVATEEYEIYIVQSGDTLANICYKEYGNATRSLEVAKFNGLTDTNQIYVGQELKMPK